MATCCYISLSANLKFYEAILQLERPKLGLEYLASMTIATLPLIIYGLSHKKYRKTLAIVGLLGLPIGFIWDYISVNLLQLWFFNPSKITGIWILGLPLEEYMFFVLTSMMAATVTLLISDRIRKPLKNPL